MHVSIKYLNVQRWSKQSNVKMIRINKLACDEGDTKYSDTTKHINNTHTSKNCVCKHKRNYPREFKQCEVHLIIHYIDI